MKKKENTRLRFNYNIYVIYRKRLFCKWGYTVYCKRERDER